GGGLLLGQERGWWRIAGDRLGIPEVVEVVTPAPAHRQDERVGLLPATGTPDPLLIIEALGRHVRLENCLEWTDVDPDLYRRRHGEEVDDTRPVQEVLVDE